MEQDFPSSASIPYDSDGVEAKDTITIVEQTTRQLYPSRL